MSAKTPRPHTIIPTWNLHAITRAFDSPSSMRSPVVGRAAPDLDAPGKATAIDSGNWHRICCILNIG